jgi:phage-related protein
MKLISHNTPYWLATVALGASIAIAPAHAQSPNSMPTTAAPPATAPQDQDVDRNINREAPRGADRDDLNRRQLASFDQFLDSHPEVAEQLRKNPSLVDNRQFVENHPALQTYLQQHPEIREDIKQNPNTVMHQEERFDRQQDRDRDRTGDDHGITRTELANLDRFMDSHPEIAEQLRKDPSLADNKQFVENHPALRDFLADHPGVREELKNNPNAFMHREERFDQNAERREDQRNLGITRGELANMDRFMDSHPEIAQQLRKDPSLVDNKEFVQNHPALQEFLASHPGVREEYKQHPVAFMHDEDRFDRREDSGTHIDSDVTRGELSSFHAFLQNHSNIDSELSKNPSLATNQEYLENHSDLRDYLQSNPQVHEELAENPQSFLKSAQQFQGPSATLPKPTAEPKVK